MAEYRIVVVGTGGVGKSALTVRFIQGNFVEKYDPTIEDSYRKQVDVDGVACMLDILDTAEMLVQEEYSALRDQYMKTGQGFVLGYAITSITSFEALAELRDQIIRTKEQPDIPLIVVGNKCDLDDERAVSKEEGRSLAEGWGVRFMETSAKKQINVDAMFFELVRAINEFQEKHSPADSARQRREARKKKKKGICTLI